MSVKETKSRKYELVAPEGGWGYMIGLGVILNLTTTTAFISCFGMIFKDLFELIDMDSTSITLYNGVTASCVAMSGFISTASLKYMSIRQVGLLAALSFNIGTLGTVFANSKFLFFLSQGIFQGLGNGMIFNLSCTMLNNYFVKRKLLAFSLTQSIVAITCLLSPQLVKWSHDEYGYRGTLLLVAGVSLHNIVGMALMQPVAWHMKKVELLEPKDNEMKSLLKDEVSSETTKVDVKSSENSTKGGDVIDEATEIFQQKNHTHKGLNRIEIFLSRFLDISLVKSFVFSNASLGLALTAYLDYVFITLLPQSLYAMKWSESDVASALSLNALGDLVTRGAFILMNSVFIKIGSHALYVIGLFIGFVSRIGFLWTENKTVVLSFVTIMGIARCGIMLLIPVVVADSVSQDKFTAAMGFVLFIFGLSSLTVGPLVGIIRDYTNSYTIAFSFVTLGFGLVVVTWSVELIYKKIKSKRSFKTDTSSLP